jgi:hypothetical protein
MNNALQHMLGYITDDQMNDAKSQGLDNDTMHMLGYLDTPQWVDAYKRLDVANHHDLLALAKSVDRCYNTCFYDEMVKPEPIGTKVIELPIGGIVITIDYDEENRPISGNITDTELTTEHRDEEDELYNAGMDAILAMVLAHAMAEIDVTSPAYIEGLETAVNAVENNS